MSNRIKEIYEFEGFRLDTENPSLWLNNELVSIPPKALETLILLVRKQGEIVSRNELLDTVWHETFVEESNINYTISLIRKILGEKEFIQTIPRRGYRFTLPAKIISDESEIIERRKILPITNKKSIPYFLIGIILISILFVSSFAYWLKSENSFSPKKTDLNESTQAYLRGKTILEDRDVQNREEKAVAEFQKAVTLDPASALAQAGLAEGFSALAVISSGEKSNENHNKAIAAAEKSISLDGNLAEAYAIRGWVKRNFNRDFANAESDLKKAIELKPDFALAYYRLSQTLAPQGKNKEALAFVIKANELNPVSEVISQGRFPILESSREYEKALKLSVELLKDNPANMGIKRAYATFLYHLKDYEKVIEIGEEVFKVNPERKNFAWLSLVSAAYFQKGNFAKSDEYLQELIKQSEKDSKPLYSLAMNYAEMNKKEAAIDALIKCFDSAEERMVWLKTEPRFVNINNEPKFIELLNKLNLR